MTLSGEYDYTVVNDEVARAAAEVAEILEK